MMLETDISLNGYAAIIGVVLSIILTIVWIVHRRKRRKVLQPELKTNQYSSKQVNGIIIIVVLIIPFTVITMGYFVKAILFLWIIPINFLSNFPFIQLPLQTLAIAFSMFLYFAGPYYIGELLWPTKKKGNEDNIFM